MSFSIARVSGGRLLTWQEELVLEVYRQAQDSFECQS